MPKNASGGSLSFTSERKGGKNAAKTNGFGFLARTWYGKYRGPSAPRMKQYKSVPCFRIVSNSIHRDALRACAARPNRAALCVYRAARCGHRPLRNPIGKHSVGADAYIGPLPGLHTFPCHPSGRTPRSACRHRTAPTAGHAGPALQNARLQGGTHVSRRTPHLLYPIRRGGVLLPTVVPTDSRPTSVFSISEENFCL